MKQEITNRNEVFQGPSPKVLDVLRNFRQKEATFYLDGYYSSILIPKISKVFGIPKEQIIISYGEEDFLRIVFDKLVPKKDSVLTSRFHYNYYKIYLDFRGISLKTFGMREWKRSFFFDIADFKNQYKKFKPKVILLTSPNNPTGNSLSSDELEKILETASNGTLVIIDEAYYGFYKNYNEEAFLSLIKKYPNLVLLRSFSKLYALAGLRIGFALCGKGVKSLLKYQNRYLGFSRILEKTAIAALESESYYKKIAAEIIKDRERFIKITRGFKNFKPFDSNANFVAVRVADSVIKRVKKAIEKEDVIVGKFDGTNLLRVTVGNKKYTGNLLRLLSKFE